MVSVLLRPRRTLQRTDRRQLGVAGRPVSLRSRPQRSAPGLFHSGCALETSSGDRPLQLAKHHPGRNVLDLVVRRASLEFAEISNSGCPSPSRHRSATNQSPGYCGSRTRGGAVWYHMPVAGLPEPRLSRQTHLRILHACCSMVRKDFRPTSRLAPRLELVSPGVPFHAEKSTDALLDLIANNVSFLTIPE